eukprot:TRINITY_DN16719_c0_g1_i1.p1 TRINITY_DN16719_c0_g1~~TRINITY_DN16719_c0_g1_i1.p1  ORF type:complete len:638 (+),score=133.78 TRINITY_DN16719_c0_g1_i1:209-2122(+)
MGDAAEVAAEALPILQWLRREAIRRTARALVPGRKPGFFQEHFEVITWPYLRQAIRVPRDCSNIGEALLRAPAWPPTTVLVDPGNYAETLVLTKPVTLLAVGDGCIRGEKDADREKRHVTLIGTGRNVPVRFNSDCQAACAQLRGFFVDCDATCAAVESGTAVVADCVLSSGRSFGISVSGFAGASLVRNKFSQLGKAAVSFRDEARGTVSSCRFEDNQLVGMQVTGKAQPTVENCTFARNKGASIVFKGHAEGVTRANVFEGNLGCGVEVRDDAQPHIEANTLRGHTMPAVLFRDRAAGVFRDNVVEANLGLGVMVRGTARPTIEGNRLRDNRKTGGKPADQHRIQTQIKALKTSADLDLAAKELAAAESAASTPEELLAARRAKAIAEEEARKAAQAAAAVTPGAMSSKGSNKRAAIVVQDEAEPLVKSNVLANNDGYGILVSDSARPRLAENELSGHHRPAIALRDRASCTLVGNRLFDNDGFGIIVNEDACPTIEGNEISVQRQEPGIWIGGTAGGCVRGNQLTACVVQKQGEPDTPPPQPPLHGIVVAGSARPRVENNDLRGFGGPAIVVHGNAAPDLVGNRLHENSATGVEVPPTVETRAEGQASAAVRKEKEDAEEEHGEPERKRARTDT